MDIWRPKADSGSAVLTFNAPSDTEQDNVSISNWNKVREALGKPTHGQWEPVRAYVRRGKPGNFVYLSGMLVCDDKAWHILQEDLHGEVEDLPILVEGLPFHIFSVLNVVDCLRLGVLTPTSWLAVFYSAFHHTQSLPILIWKFTRRICLKTKLSRTN